MTDKKIQNNFLNRLPRIKLGIMDMEREEYYDSQKNKVYKRNVSVGENAHHTPMSSYV